ncbi:cupin domain-containing protein [Suttonella ornithocola]|uniref:Uncharacterized conserved protein, contains double-stranded beta-helix domain n=1 Tax=Suttonella ornithocola TaxID=279832 RepID=A0A380MRF7_9GAMM|nr:cupin domain-containing protein [Suttonella ornithocola]SUO94291.1 Uncharacterized conserved protein, contains double-stranded beta-helix domain [Suttonella ornithocola]
MQIHNWHNTLMNLNTFWQPMFLACFNQHNINLITIKGEYQWHQHDEGDKLFLVIEGEMHIDNAEGTHIVRAGELVIIPAKQAHHPRAPEYARLLMIAQA